MNIKSFTIGLIVILLVRMNTSAQVFKNKDLYVTKLVDQMWVIETTDNTCMYILEGSKKAMLIDTGTRCVALDSVVRLITQKPLML